MKGFLGLLGRTRYPLGVTYEGPPEEPEEKGRGRGRRKPRVLRMGEWKCRCGRIHASNAKGCLLCGDAKKGGGR